MLRHIASETNPVPLPAVEAYVAELRDGLQGADSGESAAETCEEVRQHLVASVQARLEMGVEAPSATADALRCFGGVAEHRAALRREMRRTARRANPQAAFRFALALYGGVCALDLLGLAFFYALAPLVAFDALLPYFQFYAVLWLLLGSPITTGLIAGRRTGRLAVRATCRVHPPIVGSLLLASGLAYVAVLAASLFLSGRETDPSHHWLVCMIFGLACYYVIRFPISVAAAWMSGKPRRRSLPLVKG